MKSVIIKNSASFTGGKSEANNTEVVHVKENHDGMSMYNLLEFSENYSKTSESLWEYYRDQPNTNITNSESIKFIKLKFTGIQVIPMLKALNK